MPCAAWRPRCAWGSEHATSDSDIFHTDADGDGAASGAEFVAAGKRAGEDQREHATGGGDREREGQARKADHGADGERFHVDGKRSDAGNKGLRGGAAFGDADRYAG